VPDPKQGIEPALVEHRIMPERTEWEHHAERMPDDVDRVNQAMELWADAGWELVTASSVCSPIRQGHTQVWQVTHMLFWRRPRPTDRPDGGREAPHTRAA
jgi:hypothetical protein